MKQENRTSQASLPPDLLQEQRIWGAPPKSDAAFLVALRERLSGRDVSVWLSFRQVAAVGGLAMLLLVAVWLPVQSGLQVVTQDEPVDLEMIVDEFVETETDPQDLEVYLDGTEHLSVVEIGEKYVESDPSTDELLTIEPADLDLVLAELEDTEFF